MATKVPVTNLTNLANETSAVNTINTNVNNLANAIDLLLSRDGKSPNSIDANLDMNSKRIVNLPEPISDTEPARVADVNVIAADAIVARDQTLTYRNQAQTSANNATTAASQAIAAKNDAEASRVRANNSASAASNSARAASLSQKSAGKSETAASRSAQVAKQAAEASASVYYSQYDTKADASADVANIPADATILVYNDEDEGGARTIYKRESGSLVFKTVAGIDIDDAYSASITDAVPRTIRSKLEETVSVKDFGAKGDGVTDDSDAFYKAITSGARVEVPRGTYLLSTIHNYTFTDSIRLFGHGPNSSQLIGGFTWPVDLAEGATPATDCFNIENGAGVEVTGVGFTRFSIVFKILNTVSNATPWLVPFVRIKDCEFYECYCPISTMRLFDNMTIGSIELVDNHVHDCQLGFWLWGKCASTRAHGNLIEDLHRTHFTTASMWGSVYGIYSYWSVTDPEEEVLQMDSIISGNIIRRLETDYDTTTTSGEGDCNGIVASGVKVVVTGNTISNLLTATLTNCEGIYVKAADIIISDNVLIDAARRQGAITVKQNSIVPGNFFVTNNIVRFSPEYRALPGFCNGLRVETFSGEISGNRFEGSTQYAMEFGGTERKDVTIRDNNIRISAGVGITSNNAVGEYEIIGNKIVAEGYNSTTDTIYLMNIQTFAADADAPVYGPGRLCISRNRLLVTSDCVAAGARLLRVTRDSPMVQLDIKDNIIECVGTISGTTVLLNVIAGTHNKPVDLLTVEGNTFLPDSLAAGAKVTIGPGLQGRLIFRNNPGYYTRATGNATISSASTSVTFAHGLTAWSGIAGLSVSPLPRHVQLTPQSNLGSATKFWVSSVTSTNITITVDTSPGTNVVFSWAIDRNEEWVVS